LETIKYLRVSATTKCNEGCWYCFNESQPFDYAILEDIDGFKWLLDILVKEYRDYFFNIGLRFTDNDLKGILSIGSGVAGLAK